MRVCGRLAGEVAGVELLKGGFDVVEVEIDLGYHQPVGVDLGDLQRFNAERLGPRVMFLEPHVAEAETIAPQGESDLRDGDAQGCDRTDIFDRCRAIIALAAKTLPPVIEPGVLREQRTDLVQAIVAKQRDQSIIGSSRGVFERRPRRLIPESGVGGVEFGDRGVDVFDVERDLQRDSTVLVDTE